MENVINLQRTLLMTEQNQKEQQVLLNKTMKALNENLSMLAGTIKDNASLLKQHNKDQAPVLRGLRDFFTQKKDNVLEKINPTNMLRSLFGVEQGSKSLADTVISGIERKKEIRQEKNKFADEYVTYNKKGIAEKNLLGEKEARKRADELFDTIKRTQSELAKAELKVQEGKNSFFERPLKKDTELVESLKKQLEGFKDAGFVKTTDSNKLVNPKTTSEGLGELSEDQMESNRTQAEQLGVLKQIEENTRSGTEDTPTINAAVAGSGVGTLLKGAGAGFLGGMASGFLKSFGNMFKNSIKFVAGSVMKGLRFLFNPAMIGKILTKFVAPVAIIGSLASGIMDGFKEFKESGDIGKALVAGLGGILEFLSFGLFDKDTIQGIVDKVSPLVTDYVITPVMNFVDTIKNLFDEYIAQPFTNMFSKFKSIFADIGIAILEFFTGIEIPAVTLKIPGTDIGTTIGPFKPFDTEGNRKELKFYQELKAKSTATELNKATEEVKKAEKQGTGMIAPTVVNAPTTVNKSSNNTFAPNSVRNQDSTLNRYVNSRFMI